MADSDSRPGAVPPGDASIEAIYDDFARTYADHRDSFDISSVLDDLRRRLPPSGDLVDLGCGAGEPVATSFLKGGWRVTGVDVSQGMLDLANRYAPGMVTIHADMRDVSFPSESVDAVTAVYSLFHVPRVDHPALFAHIRTWLRPGGLVLFTYATRDYTGHDQFQGTISFMGRDLFYSHTTPDELMTQLAEADLTVVEARNRLIGGETFLWVTAQAPVAPPNTPDPANPPHVAG